MIIKRHDNDFMTLRPCIADGEKAMFHRWAEVSQIVPPSPMVGGHLGGVAKDIVALVEFEDGTIRELSPNRIRFLDNYFKDYSFYDAYTENAFHD